MDLHLDGRRALITGASRGIGLAAAHALSAEGVDVVLAAREPTALAAAAEQVAHASGRRALAIPADTTSTSSVDALVAGAIEALGGIDILVNSAAATGNLSYPSLAETTDEAFWIDVDTKVLGYLRTARAVAPHLVAQRWGRIINISGLGARQTLSIVRTVRNVSVAALTKNLADELGPDGVTAIVVHPGLTRTERISRRLADLAAQEGVPVGEVESRLAANSIGRIVDVAEVADVIAFLASPRSGAINGDAIAVGGGQPGVVHY